jgi:hypothetical protein
VRHVGRGPRIELIDFEEPARVQPAAVDRRAGRRVGSKSGGIPPPPAPAEGLGAMGVGAVLVAIAGFGVAGLLLANSEMVDSQGGRGATSAASAAPITVQPETAPVLPPPTEAELSALENGTPDAVREALRVLRGRDVTPAGLHAVEAVARRTTDVDLQRGALCYRVRGGAPLDLAFAALPASPAADAEWSSDGATCLVEAIAARAAEAPERALPVLVDRALQQDATPILDGLAQLDPATLPAPVTDALAGPPESRARRAAIRVAIVLGAAAKWPDRVTESLEDPVRMIRLLAHAELLRQPDEASRLLAARAIAADPADDELSRRAVEQIGRGDGFDRQLAAVAADTSLPAAARAHAADLVGLHGDAAACRVVAGIASTEPVLAAGLAAARLRIDQRFGSTLATAVHR